MHPTDSGYPSEAPRFIRDQVNDLKGYKADKAVVKSEVRRLEASIKNNEDDIDDIKAQIINEKPHACLHEGELGEMKTAIKDNARLSEHAFKTASLASDRGFRILMGSVAALVTFGVAFVVWAVSLSYTAEDALKRAEGLEEIIRERPKPDAPLPQIIIASPEYLDEKIRDKESSVTEPGYAVDLEGLLEKALTKALERRADTLKGL